MTKDEDYIKERNDASTRIIEESMMRKSGQAMPANKDQINPIQHGHTDNKYSPHRW